ncbi:MAG: hypothetical protein ACQERN_12045 [Thermodesulfobacteriota bacterium]
MKKLLIFLGGLIVVVIVLVVITLSNIGPLIEKAVNTFGPKMTQTEVLVKDVDVALLSGKAELQGFVLGNPEGFSKEKAMTVSSVRVNINEKTVTQNPVVIREIRAVSPMIHYEVKGKTDNFRTILNNLKQAAGTGKAPPDKQPSPDKQPPPEEQKGPQRRIRIEDLRITGGKVNLAMTGLDNKQVQTDLPDIHLQDIGGKDGKAPSAVAAIIFDQLYQKIQSDAVKKALGKQLEDLGVSLDQFQLRPGDKVKDLGKEAEDAVKNKMKEFLGN